MRKKYGILAVTLPAVIAVILLGTTVEQTPVNASPINTSSVPAKVTDTNNKIGAIQMRLPSALAEVPVDQIDGLVKQGRHLVDVQLTAQSVDLPIMGGGTYHAMTFNGQVPAPTIRVTQGDIVKITLTVPASEATPHSIDMHAGQLSATNFEKTNPGTTRVYAYIAEKAGTFKYHCEGVNLASMDQHVFSGMYGVVIVDPLDGYRPLVVEKTALQNGKVVLQHQRYEADAKEFVLLYNQLYLNADGSYNEPAMFLHNTTQTVINGFAFGYTPNADINKLVNGNPNKNILGIQSWNDPSLKQYQGHPLFVDLNTHYRIFVENIGDDPVFFHIVGEQLDRVVQGNVVQAGGTETWMIGGSQGAIVDIVFDNPGAYVAVNHDYSAIFTGAAAVFVAGDPFNLGYGPGDMPNPSDAVPPLGKNSIQQKEVVHCLCTDERAAEIAKQIGT